MLKTKFRMWIGIAVLLLFGLGVVQYFRATSGSSFVAGALASGAKLLLVLALVLYLVYLFDRRLKKREQ